MTTKSTLLQNILDRKDEANADRYAREAEEARLRAEAHERRKALITGDANRRLEMDAYLQKNYAPCNQWKLYRAISEFEDALHERYELSVAEHAQVEDELLDLIDAHLPGLMAIAYEDINKDGRQDTARIILRVVYGDDNWKQFIDDYAPKLGYFTKFT